LEGPGIERHVENQDSLRMEITSDSLEFRVGLRRMGLYQTIQEDLKRGSMMVLHPFLLGAKDKSAEATTAECV